MSEFKITTWVEQDPSQKPFRRAIHTVLVAIAGTPELQGSMILKGGILMALVYGSSRFTRDVDFSTDLRLVEFDQDRFKGSFEESLVSAVEALGYGLDCRVQKIERRPSGEDATFPTIRMNVGYAEMGAPHQHARLIAGNATQVVKIDYSLNEPLGDPRILEFEEGQKIQVYSLHDLAAEKLRAVLQQVQRNRARRQDIYDLHLLIDQRLITTPDMTQKVLDSLKGKARARDLAIEQASMHDPEVIERSRREYNDLASEIEGPLPDFEEIFAIVKQYYEDLPW